MKTLLTAAVGLFCVVASSHAETQPVEVRIPAKAFEGYSSVTKAAATECRYLTRAWSSTDVDGPIDSLRVFLNSDEESRINIGVSVPLSDLPLRDGYVRKRGGEKITYKDGVLKMVRSSDTPVAAARYVKDLVVEVSPDLLSPRTARTRERTKYFGIPVRTLSELRCEF